MASPRILQRSRRHGIPFCPEKNPNEVSLRWIDARSRARSFRFVLIGFVLLLQRYSLTKAGVDAEVVEAFDINDVANDVYEHNFGHRPYQVGPSFLSCFISMTIVIRWFLWIYRSNFSVRFTKGLLVLADV